MKIWWGNCYVVDIGGFWRIPWTCMHGCLCEWWQRSYKHRADFVNESWNFQYMDNKCRERVCHLDVRWPAPAWAWAHLLNRDTIRGQPLRSIQSWSEGKFKSISWTVCLCMNWNIDTVVDHNRCFMYEVIWRCKVAWWPVSYITRNQPVRVAGSNTIKQTSKTSWQ